MRQNLPRPFIIHMVTQNYIGNEDSLVGMDGKHTLTQK